MSVGRLPQATCEEHFVWITLKSISPQYTGNSSYPETGTSKNEIEQEILNRT